MEFNTGSSGTGGSPSGSAPVGGGGEFDRNDPVGSFVGTVRSVVLDPVGFFRRMQRSGDYVNPLVFALICALVNGVLGGIIALIATVIAGNGIGAGVGGLILAIIRALIGTAVGLFVGAAIYYLLVMLLVKPNSGYEATYRVLAYASVTQLVSWIPIVNIIAGIYAVVLSVIGIREAHNTSTGRAAAVVLIPTAIVLLIILIFAAIIAAVLIGAARGA